MGRCVGILPRPCAGFGVSFGFFSYVITFAGTSGLVSSSLTIPRSSASCKSSDGMNFSDLVPNT